jgi:hypothetical protein
MIGVKVLDSRSAFNITVKLELEMLGPKNNNITRPSTNPIETNSMEKILIVDVPDILICYLNACSILSVLFRTI